MKTSSLTLLLGVATFCGLSTPEAFSQAATPVPVKPTPETHPEAAKLPKHIHYIPPVKGAPTVRVNGGTRGGVGDLPALYVLAPEHEALTTNAQPELFWFQSGPAKSKFEITVTEPNEPYPLLGLKGSGEIKAGIHSLAFRSDSLARIKVELKPNVTYRWSIALIPDAKSRSKDIVAMGEIRLVAAPADLSAKIEKASQAERAAIYAEAGFWYDALQSISQAIAADPKNAGLHKLRAELLEQSTLKEAAAAENK